MYSLYLIPSYAKWHYTVGLRDLFRNWRTFILFILHFFSLKLLFRTWLSPFGRLNEEYKKGFGFEDFFETFVVNTVMRAVGFVLRTFVIITGILSILLVIFAGLIACALWILAPFILFSLFVQGLSLLLS